MVLKRQKVDILGVSVDDISFEDAIFEILRLAEAKKKGNYVVTVNSEFVMLARRNPKFARILTKANLALPDSAWVVISKLIFGGKVQSRVAGVDLLEKVCLEVNDKPIRIGFLGGFNSVAATVAKRQKTRNPRLKVIFAEPGDPTIGYDLRLKKTLDTVGRVDILFVAYGMGKQEFWIERMRKKVNVGVFIGVGGAFDYIAGVKKRAPKVVQKLGFEWLWRLLTEPSRIWRMKVLPVFLLLVFGKFLKFKFRQIFKV